MQAEQQEIKFTVLVPMWSIWHQQYFQPGDIITYPVLPPVPEGEEDPHPTYPNLELAQQLGIFEPYQEVNDGENNPDETTGA
jgi:hypothetical protein